MKKSFTALILIALLVFSSCTTSEKQEPLITEPYVEELEEEAILHTKQEISDFSYTVAYDHGMYLNANKAIIPDAAYMIRGILDFADYDNSILLLTEIKMKAVYDYYTLVFKDTDEVMSPGEELSIAQIRELPTPTKLRNQYSYAYGYILASDAAYQMEEIDFNAFIEGLQDSLFGHEPELTEQEQIAVADEFSWLLTRQYEQMRKDQAEPNLQEAETFLNENGKRQNVTTINDYCQIEFTYDYPWDSYKIKLNDTVRMNYVMRNLKGQVLDHGSNVIFQMDRNKLIAGFVEGCTQMHVGDKATVYIHPAHGYGEKSPQGIEPNLLLIFDIEIIEIIR